jgi:hypothetical protein
VLSQAEAMDDGAKAEEVEKPMEEDKPAAANEVEQPAGDAPMET